MSTIQFIPVTENGRTIVYRTNATNDDLIAAKMASSNVAEMQWRLQEDGFRFDVATDGLKFSFDV